MENALYTQLGLGTPAGRALFLLYGGAGVGREAGLAFSERNRQRFLAQKQQQQREQQQAASGGGGGYQQSQQQRQQPQPHQRRATVAMPRVGRQRGSSRHHDGPQAQAMQPRAQRRPAAAILQAMRADAATAASALPPAPSRPLVGEAEKERCALQFQFRGKPPPPPPSPVQPHASEDRNGRDVDDAAARGPASPRAALQARFDELAAEVAEREEWLAGVARDGLGLQGESAALVRHEIAVRAAEMGRLHAALLAAE